MGRMILALLITLAATPAAAAPPSVPAADAPALAHPGTYSVGFRTVTFVHARQPDLANADAKTGVIPLRDRTLDVDIWYPARDGTFCRLIVESRWCARQESNLRPQD